MFAETDREYEMAMTNQVVENESVTVEVAIVETAPSEIVKINVCVSCGKFFGPATICQAKSCVACQNFCHPSCMEDDKLCLLCHKQAQIFSQREGAKRKQQDQADKMLERSAKRFKEAEVGDTVLVPIPDLDRGRCEYPKFKSHNFGKTSKWNTLV